VCGTGSARRSCLLPVARPNSWLIVIDLAETFSMMAIST
jgi:hypothetical protein